jgi:amino acid adenylation domain-containing protein
MNNYEMDIIYNANNTDANYAYEKTIMDFFEQQVELYPDHPAALTKGDVITYRDFNNKTNALARYLREKGIGPNDIVGILLPRSIDMLVGIFAIMKAGGAYLPIDIDYPEKRLEFIIKDSQMNILLTDGDTPSFLINKINTVNLKEQGIYEGDYSNLPKLNSPDDLAYVIYTSGSTGNPKGVLIEHHSLVNRITWMQKAYPINHSDIIMQKTIYTFDVSIWEIFWWSMYGASVFLLEPKKEHNPKVIVDSIIKYGITVTHFVPSVFRMFLDYIEIKCNQEKLSYLKYIFTSGEKLAFAVVKRFYSLFEEYPVKLINLYGPTEATIDVTHFDCKDYKDYKQIPIGKPIDNTKMYILDEDNKVLPIGEEGELHIAGVGLARGYLGREDLTIEKFIYDENISSGRLYKTGDLARWLSDGNIEFLGRKDFQVKLRGLRIEIGEIEHHLLNICSIKDAVVLLKEAASGNQYLCAYVVTKKNYLKEDIVKVLKSVLPEYMVPQIFIELGEMPVKSNGKIDVENLPNNSN